MVEGGRGEGEGGTRNKEEENKELKSADTAPRAFLQTHIGESVAAFILSETRDGQALSAADGKQIAATARAHEMLAMSAACSRARQNRGIVGIAAKLSFASLLPTPLISQSRKTNNKAQQRRLVACWSLSHPAAHSTVALLPAPVDFTGHSLTLVSVLCTSVQHISSTNELVRGFFDKN